MSAAAVCVRLRRALDLRYLTAGNLARCGWPLTRIADALDVPAAETRTMVDDAISETGGAVRWCANAYCDAYVIGKPRRGINRHRDALSEARDAGWRYDLRARLLCPRCSR